MRGKTKRKIKRIVRNRNREWGIMFSSQSVLQGNKKNYENFYRRIIYVFEREEEFSLRNNDSQRTILS